VINPTKNLNLGDKTDRNDILSPMKNIQAFLGFGGFIVTETNSLKLLATTGTMINQFLNIWRL
ncbi:hypothetical protein, partial [Planktothrix sp.]|uniref:hypothetical protein n=1 Tax=Planktothrix sp. TaxID=3088171 RepID=UPI0038D3FE7F